MAEKETVQTEEPTTQPPANKPVSVVGQVKAMPESYACAVVAATIGECGICGWIRTTKDKKLDRKWQKQDEREAQDVTDMNVGNMEDDSVDNTEEDMEENEDDEH